MRDGKRHIASMDDTTPDAVQRPHEDDSASDNTGDNVLDSLPLNEYDALINSPHGAPSASKGGRNFAWTMPESLAAVHAREATNNDTQRRDKVSRTRDCSDRFVPALRALKAADAELKALNKECPNAAVCYRKDVLEVIASPGAAGTQRGCESTTSRAVFERANTIHALVVKHVLPTAKKTYQALPSGQTWSYVMDVVHEHIDAISQGDDGKPLKSTELSNIQTAVYVFRWTCPESDDMLASKTLSQKYIAEYSLSRSLPPPAADYPQTRTDQRENKENKSKTELVMRSTDSDRKRRRKRDEETELIRALKLEVLRKQAAAWDKMLVDLGVQPSIEVPVEPAHPIDAVETDFAARLDAVSTDDDGGAGDDAVHAEHDALPDARSPEQAPHGTSDAPVESLCNGASCGVESPVVSQIVAAVERDDRVVAAHDNDERVAIDDAPATTPRRSVRAAKPNNKRSK